VPAGKELSFRRKSVGSGVLAEKSQAVGDVEPVPAEPAHRPIWLCADDYGISASVNKAIRDLVMRGRLNATSVMVAAPSFDRSEAASLNMLNAGTRRVAIGLHVTLTAPFAPMSSGFRPLGGDSFLPLDRMLLRGALRALDGRALASEIATQLKAFVALFGRAPDFIDGHQHVHLFPQVRDALLAVVEDAAPQAWVRQCGRVAWPPNRFADRKAMLLDLLSRRFRIRAGKRGIATNPAFAGTYDFAAGAMRDFSELFPGFLSKLPAHSVVMCHPGFVDAELTRLDPLTTQREREYAFFAGDAFPGILRAHGVALA
jgi:predicted glycoside hydrolase/deacetylase ChbG (UPF0249 family)